MLKKISFIAIIIIISGLSGIFADRYLFPYLSSTELFNKYKILKKGTENVTIIDKTEQIYVKEETSVTRIANQTTSSVVNILSYSNPDTKKSVKESAPIFTKNGTGVIVTSDGLLMTHASVIIAENAKYKATLSDGNVYDAELVTIDSYSNLAFLKINGSNLPSISFGNSEGFKAGEKIIAIGNSLNRYENIFSLGVLNSFDSYYNLSGKTVSSSEKMEGVFRSDLPREEFYVGGPIVDYSGQVIGIVGSVEKNGVPDYFQIPANKVKNVLEKVIRKEWENNAQLGIYFIPLTPSYAMANGTKEENGAMVYSPSGQQGLAILSGSPASVAGLKIFDIITSINGEKIDNNHSLPDMLYKYKKGDEIEAGVIREGAETKTKIKL